MKIIKILCAALSFAGVALFFFGWYCVSIEQTLVTNGVQMMTWGFCSLAAGGSGWYLSFFMNRMSSVWIDSMIGICVLGTLGMIAMTIRMFI